MTPEPALLEIEGLTVTFPAPGGDVRAVRGVDLTVRAGETVGVVGESGSGKSVTMLAVMGLLPRSARVEGAVRFRGADLRALDRRAMRRVRGAGIAMVFQDPMTSLNPVLTVGDQIAEAIRVHDRSVAKREGRRRAVELLDLVGIPRPQARAGAYPHELSGGMRQRAMIAMAISNDPALLIADEPTTALDVTIQAQILDVLDTVRADKHIGIVLVTHDLGVVAGMVRQVVVMYAGQVVERGAVDDVFYGSRHPYTRGLLGALPRLDGTGGGTRLVPIAGGPPSLVSVPAGCAFHPRCGHAQPRCVGTEPALRPVGPVESRCHFAEDLATDSAPARAIG